MTTTRKVALTLSMVLAGCGGQLEDTIDNEVAPLTVEVLTDTNTLVELAAVDELSVVKATLSWNLATNEGVVALDVGTEDESEIPMSDSGDSENISGLGSQERINVLSDGLLLMASGVESDAELGQTEDGEELAESISALSVRGTVRYQTRDAWTNPHAAYLVGKAWYVQAGHPRVWVRGLGKNHRTGGWGVVGGAWTRPNRAYTIRISEAWDLDTAVARDLQTAVKVNCINTSQGWMCEYGRRFAVDAWTNNGSRPRTTFAAKTGWVGGPSIGH